MDKLVVIAPIEGTPAWRMGLQAGDTITHIEGESTVLISANDAVSKLRGPGGPRSRSRWPARGWKSRSI